MTDTINYGVTWATPDHSIAQTGFVTYDEAVATEMAIAGPWGQGPDIEVSPMCSGHDMGEHVGEDEIYGLVQIEDGDSVIEVRIGSGVASLSEEIVTKP